MPTQAVFQTREDIANRALQKVGARLITSLQDGSKQSAQVNGCYDKLRQAELGRNNWEFSIKLACTRPMTTTTFLFQPEAWSAGAVYQQGAIVVDTAGAYWQSQVSNNQNNTPGLLVAGTQPWWDAYCGPMAVQPWVQPGTTVISAQVPGDPYGLQVGQSGGYFAGELVYTTTGQGSYTVYVSTVNGNSDNPNSATPWSATTSYTQGQVVSYNGWDYMSLFQLNLNNEPDLSPVPWQSGINYVATDKVQYLGVIFYALQASTGVIPGSDNQVYWGTYGQLAAWAPNFVAPITDLQWLRTRGTLQPFQFIYPLGTGPTDDASTRNVFPLPAGYLRMAPQGPREGSSSYLGAPSGLQYTDWELQDGVIISRDFNPIVVRFSADIINVRKMNALFCEGLACRIAEEICEALTQSTDKLGRIKADYEEFMGTARLINAIEEGPTEPPIDDWVSCRI
jgi:hypothetical protein